MSSIEPLKYQLRQWREIVNIFLPATDKDRDDAGAIYHLIQSLQQRNQELEAQNAALVEALKIIAGMKQPVNNLVSNAEIAYEALRPYWLPDNLHEGGK